MVKRRPVLVLVVGGAVTGYVLLTALVWPSGTPLPNQPKLLLLLGQYLVLLPVFLWCILSRNGAPVEHSPARLPRWAPFAVYLAVVLPLSVTLKEATYSADETAYLWQSRLLQQGKWTDEAPTAEGAASGLRREDFSFRHHVIAGGKWFGKYPPGWPVVLALGRWVPAVWLFNPALGLVLLWLSYRIASRLFDENTARMSAWLLTGSPFFVLNCVGFWSHPLAGVLIAGAVYLCLRAQEARPVPSYSAAFALAAAALLVRPYVGALAGAVLGAAMIWRVRKHPVHLASTLLAGLLAAGAAAGALALYNKATTGEYLRSGYQVHRRQAGVRELSLDPAVVMSTLVSVRAKSVADTALASFPFVFLLAAYGFYRQRRKGAHVWLLALWFAVLAAGHVAVPVDSDSPIGERYFFEGYAGIAVLAAAGWRGLDQDRRTQVAARRVMLAGAVVVAACVFAFLIRFQLLTRWPSKRLLEEIPRLAPAHAVAFVTSGPGVDPGGFNRNRGGWREAAPLWLPDPGPQRRSQVAAAAGRSRWIAVSYDPATDSVRAEAGRLENANVPGVVTAR